MVYSMTAFSRHEVKYQWGNITWEIYSLNQRYLDIHLNIPKYLNKVSWIIRKEIKKSIVRGKIECTLRVQINATNNNINTFTIDKHFVHCLISSAKWIKTLTNEGEINPLEILFHPGVIIYEQEQTENINSELLQCFTETLHNLIQNRKKEGIFLKNKITERLQLIYEEVNKIHQYIPHVLDWKRKKLLKHMQDVCMYTDSIRLEQELLILAQKIDISEEIDRLINHIQEMHYVLTQTGSIGRQLEFIIQELYRETNTLTAKSINSNITKSAISLKLFIEQIREQIQNIE